ncbi:MAG TPA: urate hydroxylase PuuD [Gaiellaceae bacterium]|nr:urate hydroxylase PuuD [Gaiellaceae bacterium]
MAPVLASYALLGSYAVDWLDLVFRWFHVTAAVVWIGTSFYFVALDNHLLEPERDVDREEGVAGESWEIHGGGFYRIHKFRVAPPQLPRPLHWYKWEAYWTWLSGFALFSALYYTDARLRLIDPSVADLEPWQAILISIALLVAAWLVYDVVCRLLASRPLLLAAAILGLVTATAYGVERLYSSRAAYLQVGAMLGTIMAANVLFVIIPAHWDLVKAKKAGRDPDPTPGIVGKQRSVHNNYLTLPVLFSMLAGHFTFTYGHDHAWAALVALMAVGAAIRHYFNLRHAGRTLWWIPVGCAGAIAAIAVWLRPADTAPAQAGGAPVAFARVQQVVSERCLPCHSQQPTYAGVSAPPAGVTFDSPEEIRARAAQIRQVAVDSRTMPLGNATHMTDDERELLGQWIAQGAQIK